MFTFNEEQLMWRQTANDFFEKEAGREYVRKCDMERHYPYEFYDKICQQGWMGLNLPPEYGGAGADLVTLCIMIEVFSKYSYDFGIAACMLSGMTVDNIVLHGTEEQRQKYLPAYTKGDVRFSISMTEPEAGSDVAALTTSAVIDGDGFVINGTKNFCTGAQAKNCIICLAARTDKTVPKHRGISMILVPSDTPGVELTLLMTMARRVTSTNQVFLTDARIPRKNLLGELNKGWVYLMEHLEIERVTAAVAMVGNAQQAVDDAVSYAKQRVQFGQPIGKFQAIQHMLADRQTEVDAARLLAYRAASLRMEGIRCTKEASMAKLFASESFFRAATDAMTIYGGYAQLVESDVERYWRESQQARIGGGTSQIQRNLIARQMGL